MMLFVYLPKCFAFPQVTDQPMSGYVNIIRVMQKQSFKKNLSTERNRILKSQNRVWKGTHHVWLLFPLVANVTQRSWVFSSSICIQFGGVLLWIGHLVIHKNISSQSYVFINLSRFSLSWNWNPDDFVFFMERRVKMSEGTPWRGAGPLFSSLPKLPLQGFAPSPRAAAAELPSPFPWDEQKSRTENLRLSSGLIVAKGGKNELKLLVRKYFKSALVCRVL